jgi:hypothetical protein
MTTYAAPPISPGYAPPPTDELPPIPAARGPRRGALTGAVTAFAVTAGAAVFSAVMLARPAPAALHTVIMPPSAPTYSAAEVTAATTTACDAWSVAGEAMERASNVAADAPSSWDDPQTREAHGYEARTALIESAYLEASIHPATPPGLRSAIHDYLVATFDQEDATMHKMGSQVDAAVDRGDIAVGKVNAACGLG